MIFDEKTRKKRDKEINKEKNTGKIEIFGMSLRGG